jgi:hypothetical protein
MTYRCDDLIGLLGHERIEIRTLALTLLCDGYANSPNILRGIFASWDRWGVNQAFEGFPTLSYLPAAAELLEEVCQRAMQMVAGRKLIEPSTRAAGKLVEQQMQLPASSLATHFELLRQTVATSKIFFRVNLQIQQQRIDLLSEHADALAERLDKALAEVFRDANDEATRTDALLALEALRRQHPSYLDLSLVLAEIPQERDRRWGGFCITLQSLLQFPQSGYESTLSKHLLDHREFVYSLAVEALVRCGSPTAGQVLIDAFPNATLRTQYWIARGLQRVRHPGIAAQLAQFGGVEQHLVNSLATAILCQLEPGMAPLAQQLVGADGFSAQQLTLIKLNQLLE